MVTAHVLDNDHQLMVEILKTGCNTSGTWYATMETYVPFNISGQGRSHQEGDTGAETGRTQKNTLQTWEGSPDFNGNGSSTKAHAWDTGEGASGPEGQQQN